MTTAIDSPSPTIARPEPRTRVTFGSLVRTEWIALTSLRGTTAALIVGAALVILPAAAFALFFGLDVAGASGAERQAMLGNVPPVGGLAVNGAMFAVVVATIVGASVFAKEHTTGSLRTQLAASPRRVAMFTAKAVVVTLSTFVAAAIVFALAFAATMLVYTMFDLPIVVDDVFRQAVLPIVGAALFAAAVALFSLGVAGLLRSETWTVTLVIAFLFLVPMILAALPWQWGADVANVLLGTTGQALTAPPAELGGDYLWDVVLTIAWSAVAFFGGAAIMNRRDA